jgi:hypothetical protein
MDLRDTNEAGQGRHRVRPLHKLPEQRAIAAQSACPKQEQPLQLTEAQREQLHLHKGDLKRVWTAPIDDGSGSEGMLYSLLEKSKPRSCPIRPELTCSIPTPSSQRTSIGKERKWLAGEASPPFAEPVSCRRPTGRSDLDLRRWFHDRFIAGEQGTSGAPWYI